VLHAGVEVGPEYPGEVINGHGIVSLSAVLPEMQARVERRLIGPLQQLRPSGLLYKLLKDRSRDDEARCGAVRGDLISRNTVGGGKPELVSQLGRMATGKVYFPKQAEWLDDLVMEMSMFPVGHDDQVDALGLIGRMLDEMVGGHGPAPVVEPDNRDDYRSYDRSEVDAENDWKTI
jgi:hypothetical protein